MFAVLILFIKTILEPLESESYFMVNLLKEKQNWIEIVWF